MNNKANMRIRFKEIRKSLNMNEKSILLCSKLKKCDFYKSAKNILIYYPLKYEVSPLFLLSDKKKFYLPRVSGEELQACPFAEGDELSLSPLNISEPLTPPVSASILDLIIVPALSVDKSKYRLGYGGGYYDRFISKYPSIKTVVMIPEKLIVENLPTEGYDKKVDYVISESEVF